MEKVSTTSQRPAFGWLIAPLAVLIATLANYVDGLMSIDVELNSDMMMPIIITGVAGLLAVTPRILRQLAILPESISQTQISLAMFVLALVGAGVAESHKLTDSLVSRSSWCSLADICWILVNDTNG